MTEEQYNLVARLVGEPTLMNIPGAGIVVLHNRIMPKLRTRLAYLLYLDNVDSMTDHEVLLRLKL
jgi:hypothetical protein